MFESKPRLVGALALVLVSVLLFSGCLSLEPVERATMEPDAGSLGQQPEAGEPVVWGVGATWRYAVSGTLLDEPGFMALGIVDETESTFLVAASDPKESARAVSGMGGPLVGWVDRQSQAPHVDGTARDLLGHARPAGGSWDVAFMGMMFTMVKSDTLVVEGSPGHRVAGVSSQGKTLVATYNKEVGWFASLELRDADGRLLLGYRYVGQPAASSLVLESWQVTQSKRVTGYTDRMGSASWESTGEGDRLLFAVTVRDDRLVHQSPSSSSGSGGLLDRARGLLDGVLGTTFSGHSSGPNAVVTVLAPGQDRVFEMSTVDPGTTLTMGQDISGTWRLFASTGGPSVELVVYQVQVTKHRL